MQLLENVFTFLTFQVGLGLIAYQEGETKGVTTIKPVPFVVGGNVTKPGEFPWLVNIRFEMEEGIEKLVCGGTLIELNIVLTAAHCLTNKTTGEMLPLEKLIVVAGDYKFQSYDKTEQKSRVEKYIIHEKFERGLNDIALIKLSKKLKPTWAVSPGFLPPFNVLELDKRAVVAGWGITENGKTSDILLKAEIPIVSDPELCEVNKNLQICAGGDGHDSCDGDSGGPLMCVPGFLYICGIVSYGVGEDCGNEPGVYTNVYKYEDWIHKNKGFKPHPTQIPTLIVIGVIAFTLLAVVAIIVTFNQAFKGRNRTVTPQAGNVESDNLIVAEY